MPDKKKLLNKLYIITPFKDNNLKLLNKTIKSLSNKKTNFNILQLIIYDKSCSKLINKYKNDYQTKHNKTSYFNKFIQAKSPGIYSAINEALNLIPINSYYIVIGAGDIFIKITSSLEYPENNIIFFPYKLSNSMDNKYIKKIRSFVGGMPYCHNAIAYLNDGSKYESNYKISADYYHFLKYIKNYNLTNINKAIDDLRHSRLSEGNKILKVLNIKIKNILSIETSLRKMIPSINRQRKKNVKERLNDFLENPSEEIEKEIALQIMKQDVSEELDRIGFHVKEINKILKSNGPHGKKIDFMLQELFREANTLSVKLDNSKAKKLAINLKILVEELREQSQNIQ